MVASPANRKSSLRRNGQETPWHRAPVVFHPRTMAARHQLNPWLGGRARMSRAGGHSYGGQVITALGADAPNVIGLVYVAAFGLDEGETIGAALAQGPQAPALARLDIDSHRLASTRIDSHRLAGLRLAARRRLRQALRGRHRPGHGTGHVRRPAAPGGEHPAGTSSPPTTRRSRPAPSASKAVGGKGVKDFSLLASLPGRGRSLLTGAGTQAPGPAGWRFSRHWPGWCVAAGSARPLPGRLPRWRLPLPRWHKCGSRRPPR
jgi:pimeloyl-ACP methyl ester carboxylesterase